MSFTLQTDTNAIIKDTQFNYTPNSGTKRSAIQSRLFVSGFMRRQKCRCYTHNTLGLSIPVFVNARSSRLLGCGSSSNNESVLRACVLSRSGSESRVATGVSSALSSVCSVDAWGTLAPSLRPATGGRAWLPRGGSPPWALAPCLSWPGFGSLVRQKGSWDRSDASVPCRCGGICARYRAFLRQSLCPWGCGASDGQRRACAYAAALRSPVALSVYVPPGAVSWRVPLRAVFFAGRELTARAEVTRCGRKKAAAARICLPATPHRFPPLWTNENMFSIRTSSWCIGRDARKNVIP